MMTTRNNNYSKTASIRESKNLETSCTKNPDSFLFVSVCVFLMYNQLLWGGRTWGINDNQICSVRQKKQRKPLSREAHGNHIHCVSFQVAPHHHTPPWNKMAHHVTSTKWGYSSCCSTFFFFFYQVCDSHRLRKRLNQMKNKQKSKTEIDWLTWRCKNSKINTYVFWSI